MKRYLIFAFLSILIITLNFAFILVMLTEDVDINYGVLFLLWMLVIVAAGGLAFLERKRKRKRKTAAAGSLPMDPLKPKPEEVSPNLIYKKKSLQKFRIPLSKDFNDKVEAGFFGGYIVTEEFANEMLQAVYTNDEQLLAFISKKDEQLCLNLQQLYKEPILCWGNLVWHEEDEFYTIKGHVPVLYSHPEINRFKKLADLKLELIEMESSEEEVLTEVYLEKAENFYFLEQSEPTPSSLDHNMDPAILLSYCSKLTARKDWKKLRELEKYPLLLGRLKQPYKNEVQEAIGLARKKQER